MKTYTEKLKELEDVIREEAECCFEHARNLMNTDPNLAHRHQQRGERLLSKVTKKQTQVERVITALLEFARNEADSAERADLLYETVEVLNSLQEKLNGLTPKLDQYESLKLGGTL